MIVYKTWIKHLARYEGWFLLGFIPFDIIWKGVNGE